MFSSFEYFGFFSCIGFKNETMWKLKIEEKHRSLSPFVEMEATHSINLSDTWNIPPPSKKNLTEPPSSEYDRRKRRKKPKRHEKRAWNPQNVLRVI